MTITVVIADDHAAIRTGLAMVLDGAEDIDVLAQVANGAEAIDTARRLRPDLVLMDVRMPEVSGIEATRALVGDGICEVLVLTTFDLDEYVYGALKAGAGGFLLKSVEAPKLVEAVRLVAAGDGVLEPRITRRMMSAFATGTTPPTAPPELRRLTDREREVLGCIGNGQSNQQISRTLVISETTVKTHVSRVLHKLGMHSRVQAAIFAQEHRIC